MHPNWVLNGTPPNATALIPQFGQEHAAQTSVTQFKCDSSILNDTHFELIPLNSFKNLKPGNIYSFDCHRKKKSKLNEYD